MGAYSTLRVTRKKAIELLISKIAGGFSDEELTAFLDRELEPRLYNARIVSNDSENDDKYV